METPPLEVFALDDRVVAQGYSVELSEEGWRTCLRVRTPAGETSTVEPGRAWTRYGLAGLVVGPLVLLALVLAVVWEFVELPPLAPVLALLGLAGLTWLVLLILWRRRPSRAERVRRHVWTDLVPRLYPNGFALDDSAFLAGLAQRGGRDGLEKLHARLLPPLVKLMEQAVAAGTAPSAHLSAVRRLLVADAVTRGADPIPLVVDQLSLCFEGKLPLLYAERLLDGWESPWWTAGNLARLRVLLCDRAFEVGYEVRTLLDVGQTVPSLGTVLQTDQVQALAALRLLWSLRAGVPWDRCGEVRTVFDLARERDSSAVLESVPDLLLYQEEPDWPRVSDTGKSNLESVRIMLCARGVWCQKYLFTSMPRSVETYTQWRECSLTVDDKRLWSRQSLDTLEKRLEALVSLGFSRFSAAGGRRPSLAAAGSHHPVPGLGRPRLP